MPFDRRVTAVVFVLTGLAVTSCDAPATAGPKPSRFNAAKKKDGPAAKAAASFCEVTMPGGEQDARWVRPADKPLPTPATETRAQPKGGWTWVNLWATWCRPCVEELALLDRWQEALAKDGHPIAVELWSVDDGEADLAAWLKKGPMPGSVKWLRGGAADLPAVLKGFGVAETSPIPVHALLDPQGALRCVRVGSVHNEDYAAIKAIVSGG